MVFAQYLFFRTFEEEVEAFVSMRPKSNAEDHILVKFRSRKLSSSGRIEMRLLIPKPMSSVSPLELIWGQ